MLLHMYAWLSWICIEAMSAAMIVVIWQIKRGPVPTNAPKNTVTLDENNY